MIRWAVVPALAFLALGLGGSTARAQVKLEYKYPEGTKAATKRTTKVQQVLSLAGMDIETKAEEVVVVNTTVGKRNPDGTLPLAQKIVSIRSTIELPGGITVTFDSANPDAKIENQQVAFFGEVFKALVGVGYTVVLDAKDQVKFVEGTETFDAKLDGLDPKAAAMLRGRLSAEKIKRAFEQERNSLPNVLVRKGEPWEATNVMELDSGQTLTFRRRYEYLGTVDKQGKQLDKLGVRDLSVVYAMDPNSPSPLKATKSDLKVESSEGTILFDRDAGDQVESTLVSQIKGSIMFTAGDKELPSTLDLKLDHATALQPQQP